MDEATTAIIYGPLIYAVVPWVATVAAIGLLIAFAIYDGLRGKK